MDLDKLRKQLILHEGLKNKPYVDTVGKITIGVGHNLTDLGLTTTQSLRILDDDIADVLAIVPSICPSFGSLDEIRQRVIADMAFNLGAKLRGFKDFLGAVEAKDWAKASAAMLDSTWAKQTKTRADRLAKMMLTGNDYK